MLSVPQVTYLPLHKSATLPMRPFYPLYNMPCPNPNMLYGMVAFSWANQSNRVKMQISRINLTHCYIRFTLYESNSHSGSSNSSLRKSMNILVSSDTSGEGSPPPVFLTSQLWMAWGQLLPLKMLLSVCCSMAFFSDIKRNSPHYWALSKIMAQVSTLGYIAISIF